MKRLPLWLAFVAMTLVHCGKKKKETTPGSNAAPAVENNGESESEEAEESAEATTESADSSVGFRIVEPAPTTFSSPRVRWGSAGEDAVYHLKVSLEKEDCKLVTQEKADLKELSHSLDTLAQRNYFLCLTATLPDGTVLTADNSPYEITVRKGWVAFPSANGNLTPRVAPKIGYSAGHFLVWGGVDIENSSNKLVGRADGATYQAATRSWKKAPDQDAPGLRYEGASIVSAADQAIVWGGATPKAGDGFEYFSSGSRFDASSGTWKAVNASGAPSARRDHYAVAIGTKMLVWGGTDNKGVPLSSGGLYDPTADSWTTLATDEAPAPTLNGQSVEYVVAASNKRAFFLPSKRYGNVEDAGRIYDLEAGTWTRINFSGFPDEIASAVWAESALFTFGRQRATPLALTSLYDPEENKWVTVNLKDGPALSNDVMASHPSLAWTGSQVLLVCRDTNDPMEFDLYRYVPGQDHWTSEDIPHSLQRSPKRGFQTLWTGSHLVLWQGLKSKDTSSQAPGTAGYCSPRILS